MLVRMNEWEKIRTDFNADEKTSLNAAITGEVICPRGITIDLMKLSNALKAKLVTKIDGVRAK